MAIFLSRNHSLLQSFLATIPSFIHSFIRPFDGPLQAVVDSEEQEASAGEAGGDVAGLKGKKRVVALKAQQ